MISMAYGAGTNSTAVIAGMYERGERPDLITFANTGGEKPHTLAHITKVNNWLLSIGWPQITEVIKVYRDGSQANLYDHCFERKMLPSLAYGFKNCSQKFKIQPQEKYRNNHAGCKAAWAAGEKVIKIIGYDVDEQRRADNAPSEDKKYIMRYPLIEWGWDRDDCIEAIKRVGLPLPGKSACFFCPASKRDEIFSLQEHYPDQFKKALALEANAELTSVKGLGRRFNWGEMTQQIDAFSNFPKDWDDEDLPCGCYDGGAA